MSTWHVGPYEFDRRLLIGTAGYPNFEVLMGAVEASRAALVTVSIRRVNLEHSRSDGLIDALGPKVQLLPNTAGCYTARDAVLTAQLAREALQTDLIKLEVIADDRTLLPDAQELLRAAQILVDDGFVVMAYSNDDPVLCQKLQDLGCAAVMPLGSPIGSGRGIANPDNFAMIREVLEVPMICDAGIGTASEAAFAIELGCDAVLVNSAIARADDPVGMAKAFHHAVIAGRYAWSSGRIPKKLYAEASSPKNGVVAASP